MLNRLYSAHPSPATLFRPDEALAEGNPSMYDVDGPFQRRSVIPKECLTKRAGLRAPFERMRNQETLRRRVDMESVFSFCASKGPCDGRVQGPKAVSARNARPRVGFGHAPCGAVALRAESWPHKNHFAEGPARLLYKEEVS